MFRCPLCQSVVPPGTPGHRVVIEQRKKKYPYRAKANGLTEFHPPKKRKEVYRDDPGGEGTEIAKELLACPECAARASPE